MPAIDKTTTASHNVGQLVRLDDPGVGAAYLADPDATRRPRQRHGGRVVEFIVLHLTHMETIGVRELQQHASAALRRVARGETIGVTDRGRLVAVLSAPSTASGASALVAANRVQRARRRSTDLPEPVRARRSTSEVLDELRDDR
ncbi:MAG: type II toxin-antitoxin system Phd/YefM family antitoxin [Acidimicrobiales bacterium]